MSPIEGYERSVDFMLETGNTAKIFAPPGSDADAVVQIKLTGLTEYRLSPDVAIYACGDCDMGATARDMATDMDSDAVGYLSGKLGHAFIVARGLQASGIEGEKAAELLAMAVNTRYDELTARGLADAVQSCLGCDKRAFKLRTEANYNKSLEVI